MPRPCAALIEMKWWGHHPTHLKLFAAALLDLNCDVLCVCPAPDEMREWLAARWQPNWGTFVARRFGSLRLGHGIGKMLSVIGLGRWNPYWWLRARWAIKRLEATTGRRPDWVFIPMADEFIDSILPPQWIDRLFPYDWSGRIIHPWWFYEDDSWRTRLRIPRAARCKRMYFFDEAIAAEAEHAWGIPCAGFPEYAVAAPSREDSAVVKEMKERAAGRRIVGLFGILDRRKGIHGFVEAARKMRSEEILFAMVGHTPNADAAAELEALESTLTAQDHRNVWLHRARFEDEAEFDSLLSAADVLYAVYLGFPHSSGILSKAAAMAKPVLVASDGLMARRVAEFQLGAVVDPRDSTSAAAAIRELLSQPATSGDGPREYSNIHSLEAMQELLKREVDDAVRRRTQSPE